MAKKCLIPKKDKNKFVFAEYTFPFDPQSENTLKISVRNAGGQDADFIFIKLITTDSASNIVFLRPTNLNIVFCDRPCKNGHTFCLSLSGINVDTSEMRDSNLTFENSDTLIQTGYEVTQRGIIDPNIIVTISFVGSTDFFSNQVKTLNSCWKFIDKGSRCEKGKFYLISTGEENVNS